MKPIRGACRHLRGRYRIEQRGRSPFPDFELIRYECEHAFEVNTDEEVEKCMEAHIECWHEMQQEAPSEEPAEEEPEEKPEE